MLGLQEEQEAMPPLMPFTSTILFKFTTACIQTTEEAIKLLHDREIMQSAFAIRKLLYELAKAIQAKPLSPMQAEETAKALNEALQFLLGVQHYYSLGAEVTKQ